MSLKPALRTLLVVVGLLVFFVSLAGLVFPPLLTPLLGGGGTTVSTQSPVPTGQGAGTASLGAAFVGMVLGLVVAATGFAIPGSASYTSVPDPRFSSRQRKVVFSGSFLVLGLPVILALLLPVVPSLILAVIPVGGLAIIGALLVLVGTSGGLQ